MPPRGRPGFCPTSLRRVREELYYRDGISGTKDEYYAEADSPSGVRVAPAKSAQDALDEAVAFALLREGMAKQRAPSRSAADKRLPQLHARSVVRRRKPESSCSPVRIA